MAKPPRSVFGAVFTNFMNSIKPRQWDGTLVGKDHFETSYYEIPANPNLGKRRPTRWFEPNEKSNFQQEIPPEWEAWLRHRRKEPPTEEEVIRNYNYSIEIKKKAAQLEAEKSPKELSTSLPEKQTTTTNPGQFPSYPDYEIQPGVKK